MSGIGNAIDDRVEGLKTVGGGRLVVGQPAEVLLFGKRAHIVEEEEEEGDRCDLIRIDPTCGGIDWVRSLPVTISLGVGGNPTLRPFCAV